MHVRVRPSVEQRRIRVVATEREVPQAPHVHEIRAEGALERNFEPAVDDEELRRFCRGELLTREIGPVPRRAALGATASYATTTEVGALRHAILAPARIG